MAVDPDIESVEDTWHNAGTVAEQTLANIANKAKDKADETRDALRTHDGMTLDQFLEMP